MGKKLVAGTLCATMVLGSTLAVFADTDNGSATGTGTNEGHVDTDILAFALPTAPTGSTLNDQLSFILDPEGLIARTKNAKYENTTFGDGSLFFKNTSGDTTYSSTSDKLTITNKGTVDIDATITANVTGADGITLASSSSFADDAPASIYLALKDSTGETAITSTGATLTEKIAKAPDDAYEVVYADSKYKYQLTADAQKDDYTDFTSYDFQVTGACSSTGWTDELAAKTPSLVITWKVEKHVDKKAPSIANITPTVSAKTDTVTVSYDLGVGDLAATGVSSVVNKASGAAVPTARYSIDTAAKKITFDATYVTNNYTAIESAEGLTITVTFNDSNKTAVDVTIKVASADD
jgi:hypothetical protein